MSNSWHTLALLETLGFILTNLDGELSVCFHNRCFWLDGNYFCELVVAERNILMGRMMRRSAGEECCQAKRLMTPRWGDALG
jgi:hypothetical protein